MKVKITKKRKNVSKKGKGITTITPGEIDDTNILDFTSDEEGEEDVDEEDAKLELKKQLEEEGLGIRSKEATRRCAVWTPTCIGWQNTSGFLVFIHPS